MGANLRSMSPATANLRGSLIPAEPSGVNLQGGKSVSNAPSQGAGPHRPPKFVGPPTRASTVRDTTTEFCMVIKLDVRKILQGRPRMLTRVLFAVAKLLV